MFECYWSDCFATVGCVLNELLGADDFVGGCESECWHEIDVYVFVVVVVVAVVDVFVLF